MAQDPIPALSEDSLAALASIPVQETPSPSYVVHLDQLEKNCQLLQNVAECSGAKVLLALKGFACFSTFPLIRKYLKGTSSSGLHEALLAQESFGGEVHVYSPAFRPEEIQTLIYSVGKENGYTSNLRDWFKLIYEVLFGELDGPRMGFFVSFFGIKETIQLINDKVK